ncbi:hypothetical protein B0J11DRAFT_525055 [Dendryphion nanum]|uniref:Uncharacterized protein n=1 Tax=Dendryphion nanum TaxID=256645 RepID=A0A9P9IMZ4_9PLEO|nr:hypothetical protein B0J11DRAFT_525055 [Dendryphion nanum]
MPEPLTHPRTYPRITTSTRNGKIYLRIPPSLWNLSLPPSPPTKPQIIHRYRISKRKPTPKLFLKLRIPTLPPLQQPPQPISHPLSSPSELHHKSAYALKHKKATNCKTPRYSFCPGTRHRALNGKERNAITLAAPCLEESCKSCRIWQAHQFSRPCRNDGLGRVVEMRERERSISPLELPGSVLGPRVGESMKRVRFPGTVRLGFRSWEGRIAFEELVGRLGGAMN